MHAVAVAVWGAGVAFAAGCSTTNAGADASTAPSGGVGAPCDPALAASCLPSGDACLAVSCDPVARVCTQHVTDAGPPCNGGAAPCAKTADCDLGLVCGFVIGAGCAAPGTCINLPLPCQGDAAACATGGAVCGCSGVPVPIVLPGFAGSPTSTGECGGDGGGQVEAGPGDGAASADANDGSVEE